MLQGKRIVLGVTGSIACYKAVDLASKLTQAGADTTTTNTDPADYAFGVIVGFPRVIVGGFPRPGSFYTGGTTYSGGIGGDNAPLANGRFDLSGWRRSAATSAASLTT